MKTSFLLGLLALMLVGTVRTDAQTIVTLHDFSPLITITNVQGSIPTANLIQSGNTLYGTTSSGGQFYQGTIFKINTDSTGYSGLYSFTGGTDGGAPAAGLLLVSNTLYGTTSSGGISNNGTVFAIQTDGSGYTNLHSFTGGDDGANPVSTLVLSGNTLYGTAKTGGQGYSGTVFALSTNGSGFSTLYSFTDGDDGGFPMAGLVLANGTLFGTTSDGGSNFYGTVFGITLAGTVFENLYDFSGADDGGIPKAGLVASGNTLYGTTSFGGPSGNGTVFAIQTDGTGITNLHNFTGGNDGGTPFASLTLNGNLVYGTAQMGGAFGNGDVFAVNINDLGFTNLHSFSELDTNFDNSDGANPEAGLVLVGSTLFGTATYGGLNAGTIFAVDVSGNSFRTLLPFDPFTTGSIYEVNGDGAYPSGTMALEDSTLYGAARNGGVWGYGSVFSTLTNGSNFSTLYNFRGENDGANPVGGVSLSNGILYGAAQNGGNSQAGLLYSLPTNGGSANVIYAFSAIDFQFHNSDGYHPTGDLLLSSNRIYGTASSGGTSGNGTLFAVNTDGTGFTNLHNFSAKDTNGINSDGAGPSGGLLLANNILYGTAQHGGSNGLGLVYAISADGSGFTNLYSFTGGNDGANPMAGLFLTNGVLYGSAANGGAYNAGTLFTININGSGFSNIYTFNGFSDGSSPQSRFVGDDIFATTSSGGSFYGGTIVRIETSWSVVDNLSFNPSVNGGGMNGTPVLAGNFLYGTAPFGGANNNGTVWEVTSQCPSDDFFLSPTSGNTITVPDGGIFTYTFPLNTSVSIPITVGQILPGTPPAYMQLVSGSFPQGVSLIQDGTGAFKIYGQATTAGDFKGFFTVEQPGRICTQTLGFDLGVCNEPVITSVFPVNGLTSQVNAGDHVLINGSGLTGANQVYFNYNLSTWAGTPATTLTVVNDSVVNVTVPTGACTGFIKLSTPCSSVISSLPLVIGPAPQIRLQSVIVTPSFFGFTAHVPPGLVGAQSILQISPDLKNWVNAQTNPITATTLQSSTPFIDLGWNHDNPYFFVREKVETYNSPSSP